MKGPQHFDECECMSRDRLADGPREKQESWGEALVQFRDLETCTTGSGETGQLACGYKEKTSLDLST